MSSRPRISYIYSPTYVSQCSRGTRIKNRATMVHSLIEAYGLLQHMNVVRPRPATDAELSTFHSAEYLDYLRLVNDVEDAEKATDEQFGFGYDCPLMLKQMDYVRAIAGGTLTAAKCLTDDHQLISVNWGGGWHHAKKDEAAGFCYVNDIVLGIIQLLTKFQRVLYVDLDAHHGDGVESAFAFTSKVLTLSFHKYEEGFYPGSGSLKDIGFGRGRYHSINVPLAAGITDKPYVQLVTQVLSEVRERFNPEVIVCQCGADGLNGDPIEAFNLTSRALGQCVTCLLKFNLPTMFLGGGGYNVSNTARCWTYITSLITGCDISNDIPEHRFLLHYGPGYELDVTAGNRIDCNQQQQLQSLANAIREHVKAIGNGWTA